MFFIMGTMSFITDDKFANGSSNGERLPPPMDTRNTEGVTSNRPGSSLVLRNSICSAFTEKMWKEKDRDQVGIRPLTSFGCTY